MLNSKQSPTLETIEAALENTIPNALTRSAHKWPDRVGLVDFDLDLRMTYREMDERANRLANALSELGVARGSKVAFVLLNSHAIYECYFGIPRLGAINVPINYRFSAEELLHVIDDSDAEVLIVDGTLMPAINEVRARMQNVRKIIVYRPIQDMDPNDIEYEACLASASAVAPDVTVSATDVANIMFTSGTTGRPKGCIMTHMAYTSMAMVCAMELGAHRWSQQDKYLNVTPSFHGGSWTFCLMAVMCGNLVVTLRSFAPEKVYRAIEAENISFTWLAAPMYSAMTSSPPPANCDISSLRLLASAAAPLTTALRKRVVDCFPEVILLDWLGQTEQSCLVMGLTDPADIERKDACIGLPVALVQAAVVNDDGDPVERGEIGELVTRSPFLLREYYKNPTATAEALRDGWFFTGDMARQDDEGYFYLVGRKKDIIITGGENVPSVAVEEVLYELPEVLEAAVIGTPHDKWGECVTAFVVIKPDTEMTEEQISSFCRQRLTHYMIPRRIIFQPELPKSSVGKINKLSLRADFGSSDLYGSETTQI